MRRLVQVFGGKPVEALIPHDLERFKADLKAERWTDATVNRYLALLKSTLNLALRDGKIERSPRSRSSCFRRTTTGTDTEHRDADFRTPALMG